MKRIVILSLLIVLLAGCTGPAIPGHITGSGNVVSHSYELSGFTQIEAGYAARVQVTRGDAYSVTVEIDDNLESKLDVAVRGDTLHIGLTTGTYSNFTMRVQVTMPKLTGVTLNGASTLNGELAGEDLTLDVNGASVLTLTGTAGRVNVKANGASQALLGDLAAGDVVVDANGASRIEVQTNGTVTGTANGASTVVVTGSPTSVSVKTEGASQVVTK
jgi:hypothetical protein